MTAASTEGVFAPLVDISFIPREAFAVLLPELPLLAGSMGAWFLLSLKIAAASGFVIAADLVILYAS